MSRINAREVKCLPRPYAFASSRWAAPGDSRPGHCCVSMGVLDLFHRAAWAIFDLGGSLVSACVCCLKLRIAIDLLYSGVPAL